MWLIVGFPPSFSTHTHTLFVHLYIAATENLLQRDSRKTC